MHMHINRINVLIITITSQLRNPQPKINFCDFFFINQNSVLNNDNALYDNALKHVYKKKLLFFKLTWMIILVKSRTYSV